jgi:hypothetical protein
MEPDWSEARKQVGNVLGNQKKALVKVVFAGE